MRFHWGLLRPALLLTGPLGPALAHAQSEVPIQPSATTDVRLNQVTGDSAASARQPSLVLVTSEVVDQLRTKQLVSGVHSGQSLLMRSASSLTPTVTSPNGRWRASRISPQILAVINSAMPFSQNYGSLWAGRGMSIRTLLGFKLENERTRLILAPEMVLSANSDWPLRGDFYAPELPPGRSKYNLPYYVGAFTIDQPMRFGDKPVRRIDLGQTSAMRKVGQLYFGLSNESEWWGPGIRNAIVLSNNAPGFPHLFLRTARPLATRLGNVELRWLVGGLKESAYFDTVSTNNLRSLASIAATLQTRWDPDLSIGIARSVYGPTSGWGTIAWRWFDVFARTTRSDSTGAGKDQLFTLFGRWVFPEDGVEVYSEWGRLRLRPNLRDLLIAPNHTQGYTLGLQWRGSGWRDGAFRAQGEITQLEQSATFRDTPGPSWYTSTRAIQGYTNRGEMLGASIGPGASSQWVALDYLKQQWRLGAFGGRIRWNEDVHSNFGFPAYAAYCNHDVSMYGGIRGAKVGRLGSLTADLTIQNRLNAFFQNAGGCPYDRHLDIHNTTLAVSFAPGR